MIDFEMLVDEIRIKARAAILDGCNLDLEPSQFSDCMEYLIDRLRQAEKDAARYRWLRDLPCDSANEEIGNYPGDMWDDAIDEAMQCK